MHACCLFYVISIKPWGVPTAKGVGGKRESHTGGKKNKNRERKSEREADIEKKWLCLHEIRPSS